MNETTKPMLDEPRVNVIQISIFCVSMQYEKRQLFEILNAKHS